MLRGRTVVPPALFGCGLEFEVELQLRPAFPDEHWPNGRKSLASNWLFRRLREISSTRFLESWAASKAVGLWV